MERAMRKLVKTMESEIMENMEDYKYFNSKK